KAWHEPLASRCPCGSPPLSRAWHLTTAAFSQRRISPAPCARRWTWRTRASPCTLLCPSR
ncbi:unnamed protein product, partial [Durusdinium trenchii]